jgi:hypothetical protein
MEPTELRILVANFYPGPKWHARVARWTDEEVEKFFITKIKMDEEKRVYGRFLPTASGEKPVPRKRWVA